MNYFLLEDPLNTSLLGRVAKIRKLIRIQHMKPFVVVVLFNDEKWEDLSV